MAIENVIAGRDPDGAVAELQTDANKALKTILEAGENHLGSVGGNSVVVDLTLSLDTSAYADGDVLAEVQELASALRVAGGSGIIHSLTVVDKDDQAQAMDVVFFDNTSASLGTENSAVSISDDDADGILGIVEVLSGDYVDLVNSQVVSKTGLNIVVEVASGTSLGIGVISRGTGTYTASGIVLRVGILQD